MDSGTSPAPAPKRGLQDLSKDELGLDCALDIANGDIDNACAKLKTFFEWVYDDCRTEGDGIIERLEFRCNRINEIKAEYAEKIAEREE